MPMAAPHCNFPRNPGYRQATREVLHTCAAQSGGSGQLPPASKYRHRPLEGRYLGHRVAVDEQQVSVIAGPQPSLPVPQPARRRGRRGQRGNRAHAARDEGGYVIPAARS